MAIEYKKIAPPSQEARVKQKSAKNKDWRDPKPTEEIDLKSRYREREFYELRDFWDYVVGMEEGPFHFKLVLVPLKSDAKENDEIVKIDASRLNNLREKLVELNAKDV